MPQCIVPCMRKFFLGERVKAGHALGKRKWDGPNLSAKYVEHPRAESEAKVGTVIDAVQLLKDLRDNIGMDTGLGIPSGAGSGLSIMLT